ncbi:2-oxoglutarate-dependent dioxygenase 21, chloroplastic-like [Lycium barbarum]|uniref:2-oxoglutarate-dependent dioxygenase 21, chloroplastic-like n=1 Tax=Lycium barbarum TaxID=112863 RepID=UPI00293F37C0|nr:2-oxoglutarate-dependent dioxygenase 21, chloroplastic-like [Lycium barbarum]
MDGIFNMDGENESSSSFPIGKTPQEKGMSHVPKCYMVSSSQRPNLNNPEVARVPLVDLAGMNDDSERRSIIIQDIAEACRRNGFFQVINHGISQEILDAAISAAFGFFDLPTEDKEKFMSNDVFKPVRYGTSLRDGEDKVQFWRVFLKHYANPLSDWIKLWPQNPPDYRQKMGNYAEEEQKLAMNIIGLITEGLGLGPTYLSKKWEEGVNVMAVNSYPPCPQPSLALGLPPHSDYSILTIVLQSSLGLEILDSEDGQWRVVPHLKGTLEVHVGDHLEVLSNGLYKSAVHRVTLNSEKARVSVASLHSLGMDEKIDTAKELVDEEHPKGYKESSFTDFLKFLSENDLGQGKRFLMTIKNN